ncbi:MAG: ribbon-helix-helix domain-containing protein [Candidatus Atabeyarchaeum deiterrae]
MSEPITVTVRISKELLKELDSKVEPRNRSEYIRQAIIDKLKGESFPSQMQSSTGEIKQLKERLDVLEEVVKRINNQSVEIQIPALLEIIASDETDKKIINYIIEKKSATTKDLEKVVELRRRMILERIKALDIKHKDKFGRPFLKFIRGKKDGKRQSWWLAN